MVDRSGQRLDTYRLLRSLGSGTFGEVYLAEHITRQNAVAIKIFPRFAEKDWPAFLNEARIIRLKHPHILPVLDFGIDASEPFLVTEYIPAGTIRTRYAKGTRLPLPTIGLFIQQIASALQYAHDEKLIHRDVKPENILLRSETELLLGDFGIVTVAHSATSLHSQNTAGTLPYMAPEQIQGKAVLASDQYALGIIAYEWLCGERPFQGGLGELLNQHLSVPPPPLKQKRTDLPGAIEEIVLMALAKDPAQRFPTTLAFGEALAKACTIPPARNTVTENLSSLPPTTQASIRIAPAPDSALTTLPPAAEQPVQAPALPAGQALANTLPAQNERPAFSSLGIIQTLAPVSTPAPLNKETDPQPVIQSSRRRKKRLYLTLLLLGLCILIASGGGYYVFQNIQQSNQSQTINQTLNDVTTLINRAGGEVAHNPVQALHDLSSAQHKLQDLKHHYSLSPSTSTQLTSLQNQLVSATRSAILQYNQNNLITVLPCNNSTPASDLNSNNASSLAVVNKNTYTLANGQIEQLVQSSANQYTLNSAFAPANTQITSMIGVNSQLFALSQQTTSGGTGSYTLSLLTPDAHGALQSGKSAQLDATKFSGGQVPAMLTGWNDGAMTTLYVLLASSSTPSSVTIWAYTVDSKGLTGPTISTISVSHSVVSMAATPNQLFFLEADGSVISAPLVDHKISAIAPVLVNQAIAAPLSADPQRFTTTSSVPVASTNMQKANIQLMVPPSQNVTALLSAAAVPGSNGTFQTHLLIGDPANHRVLDLAPLAASGGAGGTNTPTTDQSQILTLIQQYASLSSFTSIKGLAADANATVTILGQRTSSNQDLVVINLGAQKSCAS